MNAQEYLDACSKIRARMMDAERAYAVSPSLKTLRDIKAVHNEYANALDAFTTAEANRRTAERNKAASR